MPMSGRSWKTLSRTTNSNPYHPMRKRRSFCGGAAFCKLYFLRGGRRLCAADAMKLNEIGVTPRKETQFKKHGIESVEDLLRCYPKDYRDYRTPVSVKALEGCDGQRAAVLGIVTDRRILQGKHAMVRMKDKDGGKSVPSGSIRHSACAKSSLAAVMPSAAWRGGTPSTKRFPS